MADKFDPYHVWLGISPNEQPANHYRLLGIRQFESDADVIQNAADQRMSHLRNFQIGQHSRLSQQLLNEISLARVCLLNAEKRAAYDAQLRTTGAVAEASVSPAAQQPDLSDILGSQEVRLPLSWKKGRAKPSMLSQWGLPLAAILLVVVASGLCVLMLRERSPNSDKPGRDSMRIASTPPKSKPQPLPVSTPAKVATKTPPSEMPPSEMPPSETPPAKMPLAKSPPSETPPSETPSIEAPSEIATPEIVTPRVADRQPDKRATTKTKPSLKKGATRPSIDLLDQLELSRDVVSGTWNRAKDGHALEVEPGDGPRVMFPETIEGSYELHVDFTRHEGIDCIALLLPVRDHSCALVLSGWKGKISGLSLINTLDASKNETGKRSYRWRNGHRYSVKVKVQIVGELVGIKATVDGRPFLEWEGVIASLSMQDWATLPSSQHLGLASWQVRATIHSMQLYETPEKSDTGLRAASWQEDPASFHR